MITRKSGTCPVMPNWAMTLSRVRVHTIVLKPTSTVLNTRSEFGTTKSVKCGLVRYATLKPVVIEVLGLMASEPPTRSPATSEGLDCVPAMSRDADEKYDAPRNTTIGSSRFEAVMPA